MKPSLLWWILLGGLAAALAGGLAWQRLQQGALQTELALLRDADRELARLRAERERLLAAQMPEEELQRLRSDRAALPRLRRELAALRAKAELKAVSIAPKVEERFAMGVDMPAAGWRSAGSATAPAALETVLWAAAGGEVEVFARLIRLDAGARVAAEQLRQSLSAAERERHATPEALLAFLTIRDVPVGTATATAWTARSDSVQSANVRLSVPGERPRQVFLVFVREDGQWKLRATEAAVKKYVTTLRGAPVAVGSK